MLQYSYAGECTAAHDVVRDTVYYIIRNAGRAVVREKTEFLPSSHGAEGDAWIW